VGDTDQPALQERCLRPGALSGTWFAGQEQAQDDAERRERNQPDGR
jgi:hypothetical protein